jgi:hypothetical protein
MRPEDGIVTVALGLGRTVVEGKNSLHFVPAYPKVPISMSTPEQAIESSQSSFYALDLDPEVDFRGGDETMNLLELGLDVAEADGTLEHVGATYVPEAGRIYDTLKRQGARLVNFAGILKYEHFPLAETLRELLAEVETAVGTPVEIEFAGCMEGRKGRPELAVLQIRPIVTDAITREVLLEPKAAGEHVILQGRALGSGVRGGICDIIYVSPDRYDRTATPEMARTIGRLNQALVRTGAESLIIAPGRWGSADRFLGIPVAWGDISSARALVEIAMPGYVVDPSQGSHFFHNITSLQLGYFAVNLCSQKDMLDLEWLESLPALHEDRFVRHVRLPDKIEVRIDSKLGRGVVMRTDDAG